MIPIHPLTICLIIVGSFALGAKVGTYIAFDKAQRHIAEAIRADLQREKQP